LPTARKTTSNVVTGKVVVTKAEQDQQHLLDALTALGSDAVGEDSLRFEGEEIVLPATLAGPGGLDKVIQTLRDIQRQQEKEFDFSRTFSYRPYDGAAAFDRAMKRVFGTAGIGKSWWSFFGEHRPQLISVEVGVGKTVQVPWDEVALPTLDATFDIGMHRDSERGLLSHITVTCPRKHRAAIEGFFAVIEDELRQRSIYRGKAITGADTPTFFNHMAVDPDRVVYTAEVLEQLQANVWSVIDFADQMRMNSIPLKRAFLLEGPFGTGKTQAGALTAQHAVNGGWTFIRVRPEDDPLSAIRTAQLYSPAVVWIEDADNVANKNQSRAQVSAVLDAMDGIGAKNSDIMVGFTTNYVDLIEKGMLRPGRIDAVIHLDTPDREALEKLIEATIDPVLREKLDYDRIAEAFDGFVPAFVVEAAQRAVRYSIAHNGGRPSVITTDDLVNAAGTSGGGLRRQLELMNDAPEASDKDSFAEVLTAVVEATVTDVIRRSEVQGFAPLEVNEPQRRVRTRK